MSTWFVTLIGGSSYIEPGLKIFFLIKQICCIFCVRLGKGKVRRALQGQYPVELELLTGAKIDLFFLIIKTKEGEFSVVRNLFEGEHPLIQ